MAHDKNHMDQSSCLQGGLAIVVASLVILPSLCCVFFSHGHFYKMLLVVDNNSCMKAHDHSPLERLVSRPPEPKSVSFMLYVVE
jgi:hypothetical protein